MSDDEVTRLMEVPERLLAEARRLPLSCAQAPTPSVGVPSMGHTHFGDTLFGARGLAKGSHETDSATGPAEEPADQSMTPAERPSTVTSLRRRLAVSDPWLVKLRALLERSQSPQTSRALSLGIGAMIGLGSALTIFTPLGSVSDSPLAAKMRENEVSPALQPPALQSPAQLEPPRLGQVTRALEVPLAARPHHGQTEESPESLAESHGESTKLKLAFDAVTQGDCNRAALIYQELQGSSKESDSSPWRVFGRNAALMCRVSQRTNKPAQESAP